MQYALSVIDDFLPERDALAMRTQACAAHYAPFFGVDGQAADPVKRIAQLPLPRLVQALEQALARPVEPLYSGFRLDYAGELPATAVHYDAECGRWAVVYYLNLPGQCHGGTAFWRHAATSLNAVPEGSNAAIEAAFRADGMDDGRWSVQSIIGMRWNRCLIYPTNYFHSRFPFEGFGTTPRDGRLVCGAFFNLKGSTE